MKLFTTKASAFLLLEQILALAFFLLCLTLSSQLYTTTHRLVKNLQDPPLVRTHLMVQQLDGIAQNFRFVDNRSFKMINSSKQVLTLKYNYSDPAKTYLWASIDDGFQPILYGYQRLRLSRQGDAILLDLTYTRAQSYQITFRPAYREIKAKLAPDEARKETNQEAGSTIEGQKLDDPKLEEATTQAETK